MYMGYLRAGGIQRGKFLDLRYLGPQINKLLDCVEQSPKVRNL